MIIKKKEGKTFEFSRRVRVNLLRLGQFLDELLDDQPILRADVARVHLHVVVRADHRDLQLLAGRRRENALHDPDFVDVVAKDLSQNGVDARLLPGARGTVHQQVRKVAARRLYQQQCHIHNRVSLQKIISFFLRDRDKEKMERTMFISCVDRDAW